MVVTIVMPVSRPDFLKRIFAYLDMMPCDPTQTNILVYVDGDLNLFEKARNFTAHSKFSERLCIYRSKGLPNVGSVRGRRKRISEIHNELKGIIKECDYILSLEDDTLPPLNVMEVLLRNAVQYPHAGFISAVEIGRWGYEMIGGWRADDVYTTNRLVTIPVEEGIQEVDAAGLYCCLIKRDIYMKHTFKPYEDILGPDVDFGLSLRQQGYKNYINHSIKCKHLTKRGEITFQKANIIQYQIWKEDDKWKQGVLNIEN